MLDLGKTIADIRVGNATVFGGLAVFPLISKTSGPRDYLTLSEAFKRKGVEITEVSEGGSVPELRFRNLLDRDILAADGETLLGAKQNRVLNSSIYVKAGDEITIPVSCVESGRWAYRQKDFRASEYSEFLSSRVAKVASVGASLKRTGTGRHSDQRQLWAQMDAKRTYFGADAPTCSMDDVYDSGRPLLDDYLKHVRMAPNQVGFACAIDGRVAGIEMFGDTGVFGQFFDRLVRAYAAEVVKNDRIAAVVPDRFTVKQLLRRVLKSGMDVYDAIGNGKELRFSTGKFTGAGLVVDDRLLHLVMLKDK